jgi:dihydroorotase
MIELRKVQTVDGRRIDHFVKSDCDIVIDAQKLMLFPALIDPHVHFRVPGAEHKEDWESGAAAAIAGGVTTVFDMPNNDPPCLSLERLREKKGLIETQIARAGIPLRYRLYLGADAKHLGEIGRAKKEIAGLKIYMGSSTGGLLMSERSAIEEAFRIARDEGVLVAVHAEDEELIRQGEKKHRGSKDPAVHSLVRSPKVAARAVAFAIEMAKKWGTRLYIAHVSSREELDMIRQAKKEGVHVYAEATPHHLFLSTEAYATHGSKALVNPPLREKRDCEALWEAVNDGTIDTIGTDHAPHTLEEKSRPYGAAPSGFASIELYFPLLLNAYHEGKLTLARIVSLTHTRPQEIFGFPLNDDVVLVDLEERRSVKELKTRAKWSPFMGWTLQGWPRYTILEGKLYDVS